MVLFTNKQLLVSRIATSAYQGWLDANHKRDITHAPVDVTNTCNNISCLNESDPFYLSPSWGHMC